MYKLAMNVYSSEKGFTEEQLTERGAYGCDAFFLALRCNSEAGQTITVHGIDGADGKRPTAYEFFQAWVALGQSILEVEGLTPEQSRLINFVRAKAPVKFSVELA